MSLTQGHISQGQGHSAHIPKTVSGSELLAAMLDLDNLSHNRIITLTRGLIAKVKVTITH